MAKGALFKSQLNLDRYPDDLAPTAIKGLLFTFLFAEKRCKVNLMFCLFILHFYILISSFLFTIF